jgi:hypothetical protein
VDEGFTTRSGVDQSLQFELYTVLRKMTGRCESRAPEYFVQSDTVSTLGLAGRSLWLLWAGDFSQSYSFSGSSWEKKSSSSSSGSIAFVSTLFGQSFLVWPFLPQR